MLKVGFNLLKRSKVKINEFRIKKNMIFNWYAFYNVILLLFWVTSNKANGHFLS